LSNYNFIIFLTQSVYCRKANPNVMIV